MRTVIKYRVYFLVSCFVFYARGSQITNEAINLVLAKWTRECNIFFPKALQGIFHLYGADTLETFLARNVSCGSLGSYIFHIEMINEKFKKENFRDITIFNTKYPRIVQFCFKSKWFVKFLPYEDEKIVPLDENKKYKSSCILLKFYKENEKNSYFVIFDDKIIPLCFYPNLAKESLPQFDFFLIVQKALSSRYRNSYDGMCDDTYRCSWCSEKLKIILESRNNMS